MFAGQDEGESTRRDAVDPFEVGTDDAADRETEDWPDRYQADADEAAVEEAGYGYGV
jgi:hypothetical protein